jgi:hypothetical protein
VSDQDLDSYIDALVAKDPSKAGLAPNVKYTENGQRLLPGDGFWNSVAGKGTYKVHIADPTRGRSSRRSRCARRPTRSRRASCWRAAEGRQQPHHRGRASDCPQRRGRQELRGARQPREAFTRLTPPARRKSRAELVRVANMYFSGMQLNDGKGNYPFADDCHRIENGGDSTNAKTSRDGGAAARSQDGHRLLGHVDMPRAVRIRDAPLRQPHPGTALRGRGRGARRGGVYVFFDHDAGKSRTFTTPSGRTMTAGPMQPWTWEIMEVFKVEDGLLHEIEAVLERAPYGMTSGWSSWDDGMSDRIQFEK